MFNSSLIELDYNALKKNLKYLKSRLSKSVKFCSVIKGNAYGHGITYFVPMAEFCGIDYFGVYDAHEAKKVLSVKKDETDLMIMGMIDNNELEWAIENNISFYVFEMDRLEHAVKAAKEVGKSARIHLELETGMNRTGFEEKEDLSQALKLIKENNEFLILEGICTHFAGAESIQNYHRIQKQHKTFNRLINKLKRQSMISRYVHAASSAATLLYPETHKTMVRVGIAQYGFWPTLETKIKNLLDDKNHFAKDPLRQILSWKSKIMSTKIVEPGNFISYGTSYLTRRKTRFATIPVGYYHGYSRSLSNSSHVLIHGKKAPVIGMINMNMMLADVTHIGTARKGDEVVLIGKQGKNKISVASFAELTNYVNYELLSRLPMEIPRVIVK
ncbi:MAG: alanine racemase [Candidatus Cloacimonetes bacterium]|nr:alanine racemase [Candidatus Cloacimonadota bacterium]MCF7813940.1 alanine racemase [Candidatus Cloacimonadota bacterium]MCF7868034.1 alanine racemase [Candidatus Cloacimonadota bacterium]MCF7883954.1 alanine racemase [Candidatus Cloacimonadota bacterium]